MFPEQSRATISETMCLKFCMYLTRSFEQFLSCLTAAVTSCKQVVCEQSPGQVDLQVNGSPDDNPGLPQSSDTPVRINDLTMRGEAPDLQLTTRGALQGDHKWM